MPAALYLLLLVFATSFGSIIDDHRCQIIDLTHPFDRHTTIYWPGARPFQLSSDFKGVKQPDGYFYAAFEYSAAEHGGTHIDAPYHFSEHAHTVDQVPLWQLIGDACVIDVSDRCADNRDYRITIDDIRQWEVKWTRTVDNCIVLFRTDYSKHWMNKSRYLGIDSANINQLHFPGINESTAEWLVNKRHVKSIGIDTASIDYGASKDFKTHQIILGGNIPDFENVKDLHRLPPTGATIIGLPMNIAGGSGAPIRIIAIICSSSSSISTTIKMHLLVMVSYYYIKHIY